MKIVMLCEFYDPRLEYQENLLSRAYRRHGHDVVVLTSKLDSVFDYVADRGHSQGDVQIEQHDEARVVRLPFRLDLLRRIRVFQSIRPWLEQEAPDLIFVHDIVPNIVEAARYVRGRPDCAMIMDYHADATNSGANWASRAVLHGVVRKAMLDFARPQISRIFPVVPASADFLRDHYKLRPEQMELLPLGADLDFIETRRAAGARARLRAEIGVGDDDLLVFTGGKLDPLKRTEEAIAAVRDTSDSAVHLCVIGEAGRDHEAYAARLRAMAAGCPRIHFRGWQDRAGVADHLIAADLAVFPASQSILWQQAIGAGLPIIVGERISRSDVVQDVSYLAVHDNLIRLASPGDGAMQIQANIEALSADRARLAEMAAGARRVGCEVLSYDRIVAQTLRFVPAVATREPMLDEVGAS